MLGFRFLLVFAWFVSFFFVFFCSIFIALVLVLLAPPPTCRSLSISISIYLRSFLSSLSLSRCCIRFSLACCLFSASPRLSHHLNYHIIIISLSSSPVIRHLPLNRASTPASAPSFPSPRPHPRPRPRPLAPISSHAHSHRPTPTPHPPHPHPPQPACSRLPPQSALPPPVRDRAGYLGNGLIDPAACSRAPAIPAGASSDGTQKARTSRGARSAATRKARRSSAVRYLDPG